jgi:hypothetical protein
LRDFVEALSQRWNTYVVGYDLRKQVHIFEELSRRYERLRSRAGVDRGPLAGLTRGPVLAGVCLLAIAGGYWVWKRRRKPGTSRSQDGSKRAHDARVESVAALYKALESALHTHGITRSPSTPPLRHAEDLLARRHPLGDEVLALTTVYLEARFGGNALTDPARRDFERRIRDIRAFRAASAGAA